MKCLGFFFLNDYENEMKMVKSAQVSAISKKQRVFNDGKVL